MLFNKSDPLGAQNEKCHTFLKDVILSTVPKGHREFILGILHFSKLAAYIMKPGVVVKTQRSLLSFNNDS